MTNTEKCRRLADAILSCFKDGIAVDNRVQHYIDACLPGLSIEEVAHRICEVPDLEIAPLMDLILFPDEALQAKLEPLLEAGMYNQEDEATVVALLEAETIQTAFRGVENREGSTFRIPRSFLPAYVRRLSISRRIPPGLVNAISGVHPPETGIRLKVMLRNSKFTFTGPVTDFLTAFVMGMDPGDKDFDACFDMALELLGGQGTETDPFRLLRLRTDALHKAKNAAHQFEEQLQRSNMETLMHQGLRAPEIGIAEAGEKIALLNRIGGAVAMGGCKARRSSKNLSALLGEFESKNGSLIPG